MRPKAGLFRSNPNAVDRKSTRLNSSHDQISYAVFCLKKKKKTNKPRPTPQKYSRLESRKTLTTTASQTSFRGHMIGLNAKTNISAYDPTQLQTCSALV